MGAFGLCRLAPTAGSSDAAPMSETEVVFVSAGLRLAGTLARPRDKCGAVTILVSGSGANDRDETVCGHKPFARIAAFLAEHGVASLRCDDRGVGGSEGDAALTTFDDSAEDTQAAANFLKSVDELRDLPLTLIGHSEGGLTAAVAATRIKSERVVMLAGPAIPIEALLHGQAETISRESGATPAQIAHERAMNEHVFALARGPSAEPAREIARIIQDYLRTWPDAGPMERLDADQAAMAMADIVAAPAYRSLLRQDPQAILAAVRCPIVAMFGGLDVQVPAIGNVEAFRLATTAAKVTARHIVFPRMNHLFQTATTGSISEYESLPPAPDEAVMAAILDAIAKD